MDDLDKIRDYIEKETGLEVGKKSRERDLTYNRAIFVRACRVLTFRTFQNIADYLGLTHASIIHSYYRTFPTVQRYEKKYYDVYKDLVENYKHEKNGAQISTVDKQQEHIDFLKKMFYEATGNRISLSKQEQTA